MDELDQSAEPRNGTQPPPSRPLPIRQEYGVQQAPSRCVVRPLVHVICRLFDQAGAPWEGETHAFKATLIEATEIWERLTGEGVPCPVVFEPEDLRKTKELSAKLQLANENFEGSRGMVGFETETWVSNEHHAMAKALAELLKLRVLTTIPEEVRAKTEANWFLNDIDETDYM